MKENSTMESDRRLVTVMFADISGFTAMSEKMDAEEVTEVMNECFSMMEKCIEEYGGTIDKFIGDCVMVLFGAPKAQEDAPHRALNTALEIRKRLQKFNEDKELSIPLNIHIGINSGPVVAGMVGGDKRQDFTVMGDTVNLASRIEGASQTGDILVADNTYRLTEGYFDFEDMGNIKFKGKEQSINVYRLIGPRPVKTRIAASMGKGLTPFVGRNRELDHLQGSYERIKEGHGQVVGIMGEPGMGKSRLIREFIKSIPAEEYTYLEGGCLNYGDATAYFPILDILKIFFAIHEDDDEKISKQKIRDTIAELGGQPATIAPQLHEVLSFTIDEVEYLMLEPRQRRDKVFEAIRLLLIMTSQKKPLIIVVEDLHWIDKTSEEFLLYFIHSLAAIRIMLVLLFRPEYNPTWSTKTFYSQILMDQLPKRTSTDLVKAILSGSEVAPELNDLIVTKASGNPLFMEELIHSLLESGSIRKEENRYVISSKYSDMKVPETIQGIIADRLDRLEANLKGIMQTASVIGREFAFRILQAVATLKDDLKSSLLTLQDLEFIHEKALFPELEYIFKHALTQEVAYNSLLIKRRKEIHERTGEAIEQIYKDRLEEFSEMLAYHYSLGENAQKAYEYLKLSGDKATRSYANSDAIRYYKDAIQALDTMQETEEKNQKKSEVYLSIMDPMMFLGYPEDFLKICDETERLTQRLGDENSLAKVYVSLGFYHMHKGNPLLGMEYAEKCFNVSEKTGAIDLMTKSADLLTAAYFHAGNYGRTVDIAHKALQAIEERHRENEYFVGGINLYSALSANCGCALAYLGNLDDGKCMLDKGLQNACVANDKFGEAWAESVYGVVNFFEGDGDNSVSHAQKGLRCWEVAGADIGRGSTLVGLAAGYVLLGEYTTAKEHAEMGLKLQKDIGTTVWLSMVHWLTAFIFLASGDLERAKDNAEDSIKLSQKFYTRSFEGLAWITLGSIKGKMGTFPFDETEKDIRHGISILEEHKVKAMYAQGYLSLGELFADAGLKDEALENLKKAEVMYLEMKVTPRSYWLKRTQEALAKLNQ